MIHVCNVNDVENGYIRLTLLELDFIIYIEVSIEKSDRVIKDVHP